MPAQRLILIPALLLFVLAASWPREAHAGICKFLFRKIAHKIGFSPDEDRSLRLEISAKWKLISKLIPETSRISTDALDLLVDHLADVSPNRIRALIDAAPRSPFWERRARAELFHLESLASIGNINHVRWVERYVALKVLYGEIKPVSVTSQEYFSGLKKQAADPNSEIALNAVMEAGGVGFFISPHAPAAEIRLVQGFRAEARQILTIGAEHPIFLVRAAARRGLISLSYNEGKALAPYTEAQRDEVTQPFREIRKQDRLPVEQRSVPTPVEPDGLTLARHEMNRLPTEVLRDFLASRRDASAAGPSLGENRTLGDLIEFLEHPIAEVRLGAVYGLAGRYEAAVGDKNIVKLLKKIAATDSSENVQYAAIEVLEDHPEGGAALKSLHANDSFSRRLAARIEEALEQRTKTRPAPPDAEVVEAILGNRMEIAPEAVDFSRRSLHAVRTALASGNFAWQKQAIRGLKGRTDLESLDVLAQVMGVSPNLPLSVPLGPIHFSSDLRSEALTVANLRNHPIVDRMFERARSSKESPRVNRTATRLTEQLALSVDNRGILPFRTVTRRLKLDADALRQMRDPDKMTPEEKTMDEHAKLLDASLGGVSWRGGT